MWLECEAVGHTHMTHDTRNNNGSSSTTWNRVKNYDKRQQCYRIQRKLKQNLNTFDKIHDFYGKCGVSGPGTHAISSTSRPMTLNGNAKVVLSKLRRVADNQFIISLLEHRMMSAWCFCCVCSPSSNLFSLVVDIIDSNYGHSAPLLLYRPLTISAVPIRHTRTHKTKHYMNKWTAHQLITTKSTICICSIAQVLCALTPGNQCSNLSAHVHFFIAENALNRTPHIHTKLD